MADVFKLCGVVEYHACGAGFVLPGHSNGNQDFQCVRSLYGQRGTSFINMR
jgi:hypothetical protein